MEDALKDQSSVSGNKGGGSAKLLRFPLRSATRSKDDKPPVSTPATASASRRVRPPSSVSQSVGVLDLSSKEKSAKPPRRLSIPTKSASRPTPKLAGNITPISEARANRSGNIKGKSDAPVLDISRSLSRRKFSVLSSASYWLSQIKLSEVAAKHQVSIGFFKLAQEAACENLQLLRDELKLYAIRHNLLDLGESAKEVFRIYNITEDIKQLQVSETCCSHPEEGTRSSSDDAHSLSSVNGTQKLKSRSLSNTTTSAAKETTLKNPVTRIRGLVNKKMANQSPSSESVCLKMEKKLQKPSKKESNKEKQVVKSHTTKSVGEKGRISSSPEEAITEENKENLDAPATEGISLEA